MKRINCLTERSTYCSVSHDVRRSKYLNLEQLLNKYVKQQNQILKLWVEVEELGIKKSRAGLSSILSILKNHEIKLVNLVKGLKLFQDVSS